MTRVGDVAEVVPAALVAALAARPLATASMTAWRMRSRDPVAGIAVRVAAGVAATAVVVLGVGALSGRARATAVGVAAVVGAVSLVVASVRGRALPGAVAAGALLGAAGRATGDLLPFLAGGGAGVVAAALLAGTDAWAPDRPVDEVRPVGGQGAGGVGPAGAAPLRAGTPRGRRVRAAAAFVAVVPVAVAAVAVAAATAPTPQGAPVSVTLTADHCVEGWHGGRAGTHTFAVTDRSGAPGEVDLDDSTGAIVADIVDIAPGTTVDMTATLGAGHYGFACYVLGRPVSATPEVAVTGTSPVPPTVAVAPVSTGDLAAPVAAYEAYARAQLKDLSDAVAQIQGDLRAGNLASARREWLDAQEDWERVGASYDSFGLLGEAVDGLPGGLSGGVDDPDFTGLHRLEYGLWHGQSAAVLLRVATYLAGAVGSVETDLDDPGLAGNPANLPVRAHEIIEDAVRDHLSGLDDEGAGEAMAETYADEQVDQQVLADLRPLLARRAPGLVATLDADGQRLGAALLATRSPAGAWQPVGEVPLARREAVDAAAGQLLEDLADVPTVLKIGIGA